MQHPILFVLACMVVAFAAGAHITHQVWAYVAHRQMKLVNAWHAMRNDSPDRFIIAGPGVTESNKVQQRVTVRAEDE